MQACHYDMSQCVQTSKHYTMSWLFLTSWETSPVHPAATPVGQLQAALQFAQRRGATVQNLLLSLWEGKPIGKPWKHGYHAVDWWLLGDIPRCIYLYTDIYIYIYLYIYIYMRISISIIYIYIISVVLTDASTNGMLCDQIWRLTMFLWASEGCKSLVRSQGTRRRRHRCSVIPWIHLGHGRTTWADLRFCDWFGVRLRSHKLLPPAENPDWLVHLVLSVWAVQDSPRIIDRIINYHSDLIPSHLGNPMTVMCHGDIFDCWPWKSFG